MTGTATGRAAALVVVLVAANACEGGSGARPSAPIVGSYPSHDADALPACPPSEVPIEVETVAEGLEVPWGIAFPGDDRIFVTERPGRIRVIREGHLDPRPWADLDVWAQGEAGLLGIEAHGDTVWVAGTFDSGPNTLRSFANRVRRLRGRLPEHRIELNVLRLVEQERGRMTRDVLLDGVPAASIHAGGALRIGPDGVLYIGTGDAGIPAHAPDRRSAAGSILMFSVGSDRAGTVATGVRNVQGLAWHPGEVLFATDHGPTGAIEEGRREGMDELLAIEPGANYGWPHEVGAPDSPAHSPPLVFWVDAIAPAGLAFWSEPGAWFGDAFIGALAARDLIRVDLDDSLTPLCTQRLLNGRFGRIRAVRMAPDGWLYFTTSNHDGRGEPTPAGDRLLRLRPGRT